MFEISPCNILKSLGTMRRLSLDNRSHAWKFGRLAVFGADCGQYLTGRRVASNYSAPADAAEIKLEGFSSTF